MAVPTPLPSGPRAFCLSRSKGRRGWAAAAPLLLALLGGAGCRAKDAPDAGPRNLLLITLDTVRADHLGSYGYAAAETPALDRLAREGARFAQASSPVPLTLPAHSSLLSGLLPPRHGLRNNGAGRFPAAGATLATVLGAAGYRTGAFVGAFVLDHRFGLDRGFEVYDDDVRREAGGGPAQDAERPGNEVVDRALAWLERSDARGRPFFLWVHLYDAHAPYAPPAPYGDRHPGRPYDGEIAFADAQVGRLLAALDRLGLDGRTVVAAAADHGESLGEHGELTHGLLLYEPTLHVPLLLRAPGTIAAGRVVHTPVSLVDLAPTLAGLVGQPWKSGTDGRDLSPALAHGEEPGEADLYAETQYPRLFGWSGLTALRRRDRKYIRAPRPELYDLRRDPGESANLAAGQAAGAEARRFDARLSALSASSPPLPQTPATAPASDDAEARARLESLGYAAPRSSAPLATGDLAGADPKDRVALFRRFEEANTALREGKVGAATAELESLVAADPGNPVFRGKLAETWRERGGLAKAIPLYRQAAAAAPADSEAWYNLGVALEEAGQSAEARRALAEAVRLDPARPEVHNAYGIALLHDGSPDPALAEFERAIALDGRNARAFNNLGNVLRGRHRLAEAETAYRRATALAPRYAEAWNGLGTLEVERDRPAEALPCFDRALALAPEYHEVRLNRAIAYELMGNTRAAAASYRDFLAAAGQNPEFGAQRRAAQQLLARLTHREAGLAPEERR
ncbi:MAG TPA: sulfatase-like hydrolase/transferase [Thermoanaerobaculia bacterium]|nr:sulfatase-like hydrolase/transferase [Thermoanaerobaculia bacterium]